MINTAIEVKKRQEPANWLTRPQIEIEKEKHFSADKVIDAYFTGKKHGLEENKKTLLELFSDNLELAKKNCEEFFTILEANSVRCAFVALRATDVVNFDAIFTVPAEKFLAPDFDNIYKMALDKKNNINTDTFKLYFSFMPLTNSLDEGRMLADGFILKYGEKQS
jgi:hypothetical protein